MKKLTLALMFGVGIACATSNADKDLVKALHYRKAHQWDKAYKYFKKACDEGSSDACAIGFESKYNEINGLSLSAKILNTYLDLVKTIHKSCDMKNPIGCFLTGDIYATLGDYATKHNLAQEYKLIKRHEDEAVESCVQQGIDYHVCKNKISDMVNILGYFANTFTKTPQEYIKHYGTLACEYAKDYKAPQTNNETLKKFYKDEAKFIKNYIYNGKCIAEEQLSEKLKKN